MPEDEHIGSSSYRSSYKQLTSRNPLYKNEVRWDQRTKMIDWMVEVSSAFQMSGRAYFVAANLFDQYLRMVPLQELSAKDKKLNEYKGNYKHPVVKNDDVHLLGCTCMYLASKYEDVYPMHSKTVSSKIAHNAFSKEQIIKVERKILTILGFDLNFVLPIDFYQIYIQLSKNALTNTIKGSGRQSVLQSFDKNLNQSKKSSGQDNTNLQTTPLSYINKIEQTGIFYMQMALQSVEFSDLNSAQLAVVSLLTACVMLQLREKANCLTSQSRQSKEQHELNQDIIEKVTQIGVRVYSATWAKQEETKLNQDEGIWQSAVQVNTADVKSSAKELERMMNDDDFYSKNWKAAGQISIIKQWATKLYQLARVFEQWHPGLNQLFKHRSGWNHAGAVPLDTKKWKHQLDELTQIYH